MKHMSPLKAGIIFLAALAVFFGALSVCLPAEPAMEWKSPDGVTHAMGCLPPPAGKFKLAAAYGQQYETYSRADCIARIQKDKPSLYPFCYQVLNQNGKPWCWAFGPTQSVMTLMYILTGDKIILDPCVGPVVTGVRGGNSITAMIEEVQSVYGCPSVASSSNNPITGSLSASLNAGWKDEAKKWIVPSGMWLALHSPEEMASALINGHPVVIGTTRPWGGHCICALEAMTDGQKLIFSGANSWGASWANDTGSYPGRPGWFQLSESTLSSGGAFTGNGLGSYALVGMIDSNVKPPLAKLGPGTKSLVPVQKTIVRNGHSYKLQSYQTAP